MKEGPNFSQIAALIGDPARGNILTALMSGKALTASELASEAGVSAQTASVHLSKLRESALVSERKSGRHKYFTLASDEVADVLEALMGLAATTGNLRTRTGPKDAAMRDARVCYNHLAGNMGVQMYRAMRAHGHIVGTEAELKLSDSGKVFIADLGVDIENLPKSKSPLCKSCLDWSERESHLSGQLGRALLTKFYQLGWARRLPDSRVIEFTKSGKIAFEQRFGSDKTP
ncbi:ArsR/SmtB family transcription factor [Cognatishimia activa]|uniref:ArsR/SmtB family transcription factor n=1 Tax=Cognatishimia activa TaxID=1715691 RepID=UPI00222E3C0E|nr:winged helix-turn-helix domain-containing protein [Cognatishimia activa]UZD90535.1 winged helix-turn-helix domain-containing protein [Cognatishimia activa]